MLHTLLFLLMIGIGIPGSISFEGRVTYLSILKSFELWLKNKQESALKYSDLIKGVNISQMHLTTIVNLMGLNNSINGFYPETIRNVFTLKHTASTHHQCSIPSLSNTILLRGMWHCELLLNSIRFTIGVKCF